MTTNSAKAISNQQTNLAMIKQRTVYDTVNSFLRNHAVFSENTANNYERNIRLFFQVMRNKAIEELQAEDLRITLSELKSYQTFLVNSNKYKNTTINNMIESGLRSLYTDLKANEFNVNVEIFEAIKKLPNDSNRIGYLSPDEALKLANLAVYEKHSGFEKKALLLLAISTSIRKDAILKIRYCDIQKHPTKNDIYIISSDELFDKGKMVSDKEIHEILYQMLIDIRENKSDKDPIFNISINSLDSMIKRLCDHAGIDWKSRRISWHSLKSAGISLAYMLGGLYAAQIQGGHSSPTTTAKHYMKKEVNLAGAALFNNTPDDICDDMTKEELLELIKMQQGDTSWIQVKRNAVEIKKRR